MTLARPQPDECNEYFAGYVAAVVEDDVLALLARQRDERRALLGGLDDAQARYCYEQGKWSVKEVLGHLVDCERVFAYRAISAARGDETPLPGFDHDAWVAQGRFDERPLPALLDEFDAVRNASLALFGSLDEQALGRVTVANGSAVTPRALAWILAGHERHHMDVIRQRYL